MIIDFHTHTLLSDGELVPAELVRRAFCRGYRAITIADHVDMATIDEVVPVIISAAFELTEALDIAVIAGVEITHVPPALIPRVVERARKLGAELVIVHGETIVEPVAEGTNKAALSAGIDILAHPGLITEEEAQMAKKEGICLEISARKGHCLTNGHVARVAKKTGAQLIVGSDAHGPGDLLIPDLYEKILRGAGLGEADITQIKTRSEEIVRKIVDTRS